MQLHFRNQTGSTIWVCIMFYSPDGCADDGSWGTRGWWALGPNGGEAYVLNTDNDYAAFYVESDQIILRVAGDVAGITVTLSNGRHDRLTLYSDPTHPGVGLTALVYPRNVDIHRIDLSDASGKPLPDRL